MRDIRYLDFQLHIGCKDGAYEAQVWSSPAGPTEAVRFALPPDLDLAPGRTRTAGEDSGSERAKAQADRQALVELGRGLAEAVLPPPIWTQLALSLSQAKRAGAGLRIRLIVECDELAAVPWEYLWSAPEQDFMALSNQTPVVRTPIQPQPVEPLAVVPPLSVLVMISDPSDLPALDVEEEWRKLNQAVGALQGAEVRIERLEEPSMPALQQKLWQGEYNVFHFIGHGAFDPSTGEGVLAMKDPQGKRELVSGHLLGTWLNDHPPLRLAVLNSCEGARAQAEDPFGGIAQILVRRGVPAVIAMQYRISDRAALTFSQFLYGAIAHGYPVDASVAEARKAISHLSQMEWATPVLYLLSSDGRLFDVTGATPAAPVGPDALHEAGPPPAPPAVTPSTGAPARSLLEEARTAWALAAAEPEPAGRTAKLQEAYELLKQAREEDPTDTEVLLQTAELLVELTPDDPEDERRILEATERLLHDPKDAAEKLRLGMTLYRLAGARNPPELERLQEAHRLFEELGRTDMAEKVAERMLTGMLGGELGVGGPSAEMPAPAMPVPGAPPPAATTEAPPVSPLQGVPMLYGRWLIEDSSGGQMLLDFLPNGTFAGTGRIPQLQQLTGDLYLAGQWFYDVGLNVLTLQGLANGFMPFASAASFQGQRADGYVAADTQGETWTFRRG